MKSLRKFRWVNIIVIICFLFSLLPVPNVAAHNEGWQAGGEPVGDTAVPDMPKDDELPDEPNEPCSAGDPVYIHSGEFYYECVDLFIPGQGMDLEIKHLYQSGMEFNGQFGYGWTLNYYKRIKKTVGNDAVLISGNGKKTTYEYDEGADEYITPFGFFNRLVEQGNGSWVLTEVNGEKSIFDFEGKLITIEDRNGNQINFEYDQNGLLPINGVSPYTQNIGERVVIAYEYRLTKIIDTVGREIYLAYNADGRLESITHEERVVSFGYDPVYDFLQTVTQPATEQFPSGTTKTFDYYTDNFNLKSVTDAKGQIIETNYYDDEGRVYQQDWGTGTLFMDYEFSRTTVTDRKGYVTIYDLTPNGNVEREEILTDGLRPDDPASFVILSTYNENEMRTSVTYPNGNGTKWVYDTRNLNPRARTNLLKIRHKANMSLPDDDVNDIVNEYSYEPRFNQIKTFKDGKGNITTNVYDYELPINDPDYGENGNLVLIQDPMVGGNVPETRISYDDHGNPIKVVDPAGITVEMTYHANGQLATLRQDPLGKNLLSQFTYDNFGNLNTVIDQNMNTMDFDFDETGLLRRYVTSLGYVTEFDHDANGNVIEIRRQANEEGTQWQTTKMTYTIMNQIETTTDPLNRVTTYNYDRSENLKFIDDAKGNRTRYVFDERNLLFLVTDANTPQGVTKYDYDGNGNLKRLTDANSNQTNYTYDLFDRLSSYTYADTNGGSYNYDKNNNTIRHTTPSAKIIEFDFDELNRLVKRRYLDSPDRDVTFVFDLASKLTSVSKLGNQIVYNYDNVNRVDDTIQTINSFNYTTDYTYDGVGNVTQIIYPSGKVIDQVFDADNRMIQVKENNVILAKYIFDPLNRIDQRDYMLDQTLRANFQFDLADQLGSLTNTIVSGNDLSRFTYLYDDVSNRTSATTPLGTLSFTYDDIYQLTGVDGAQVHNYTYDLVHNLLTADGISYVPNVVNQYDHVNSIPFTYDGNGNLTSNGTNTYTYSEDNKILSVQNAQHNVNYEYDVYNQRIYRNVDGEATYFVYNGDKVIEERSANNTLIADYIYGIGVDEILQMERSAQKYFYHYDGLGSVIQLTDRQGNIIENYSYDVYGMPSVTQSSVGNPYLYTGRRWEPSTNIYYYRARDYDPTIGRFLQRDPVGYLDSMNLYQYTRNNPINFVDPSGENLIIWLIAFSFFAKGVLDWAESQKERHDNFPDSYENPEFAWCLKKDRNKNLKDGVKTGKEGAGVIYGNKWTDILSILDGLFGSDDEENEEE